MTSKSSSKVRTSSNHKFWTEFFILYKNLPALWDTRSHEYKNRDAKVKACEELAVKLSEVKPNSKHEDVLRQINIFRTNYRRERTRMEERRLHCKNVRASLWYFNLLSFLDSQEPKRKYRRSKYHEAKEEETNSEAEQYAVDENWELNADFTSAYETSKDYSSDIIIEYSLSDIEDEIETYECFNENELNMAQFEELQSVVIDTENVTKATCSGYVEYVEHFQRETCNEVISLGNNASNECQLEAKQYSTIEHMRVDDENNESNENYEEDTLLLEYDTAPSKIIHEEKINEHNVSFVALDEVEHPPSTMTVTITKDASTMTDEKVSTLTCNDPCKAFDNAEILAKAWALQYNEMSNVQKIYARRAIADILFAGCMGKLGTYQEKFDLEIENAIK